MRKTFAEPWESCRLSEQMLLYRSVSSEASSPEFCTVLGYEFTWYWHGCTWQRWQWSFVLYKFITAHQTLVNKRCHCQPPLVPVLRAFLILQRGNEVGLKFGSVLTANMFKMILWAIKSNLRSWAHLSELKRQSLWFYCISFFWCQLLALERRW